MNGKTVWLTGASQGIGRAVALRLAEKGCRVAVTARNGEALQQLAEQFDRDRGGDNDGEIVPYPADLTNASENRRVIEAITEQLGPIDLAILNAGTHTPTPADNFHAADVHQLIELNLMAPVYALEILLPLMRERNQGHIAAVASVAGYRGLPNAAGYGASKAGLINLLEALRLDLWGSNIKLQVINPGFVKTPLTDQNNFPMPSLITAEQAAQAIVNGLAKNRFEICFPWAFTRTLKALRLLPYRLYLPLVHRATQGN